jgi:hypothetical protein
MAEKLNEPVEVWAGFAKGKLTPLRFCWRGRAYPIRQTEFTHCTNQGSVRYYFFSVAAPGALYQLVFNSRNLTWRLTGIDSC